MTAPLCSLELGSSRNATSILHERDGRPNRGIVVGRLDDGRRFLANTPDDRAVLESLMAREGVGRTGVVSSSNGANCFEPD